MHAVRIVQRNCSNVLGSSSSTKLGFAGAGVVGLTGLGVFATSATSALLLRRLGVARGGGDGDAAAAPVDCKGGRWCRCA